MADLFPFSFCIASVMAALQYSGSSPYHHRFQLRDPPKRFAGLSLDSAVAFDLFRLWDGGSPHQLSTSVLSKALL
ncbi:hypothetical protein [Chthonomonas calidirosea]|uniref:hypothetical protein n=1 Tax=Chthonomonas calidirosea TaxID=454171 RepID=UPI0012E39054|nr:hypothetical protein [Chthonomonas calidirosea]